MNTAYAYLAEQAEAADAVALPAYRVAQLKEDEIHANSRRTALDSWLEAPMGRTAEREDALVRFLTS